MIKRENVTYKKVLSIITALIMAFGQSGYCADLAQEKSQNPQYPDIKSLNVSEIDMPLSYGYIREYHKADTDKPLVIYIQDAHCNYSCQKSIESIVDFFNSKYGVNFAALEGGYGSYNFSLFTDIPDVDIRHRVTDYFVREGRITGVELYAIMNPDKIDVKGLEEPKLYEKNLDAYRQNLSFKDRIDQYMGILKHYIDNLKTHMFGSDIKEFDQKKREYDDNKSHLKDYVVYINEEAAEKNISLEKFSNLNKLMGVINHEKDIDFEKAQKERDILVDEIMNKLSKAEMAEFVNKSLDFKKDNITAADFHYYIFAKARSCNIDLSKYPNLTAYKVYLDNYDKVEKDVFFDEIFDVEKYMADNIASSNDEKKLYYLANDLNIMDKLFSVSLTRKQYDYFNMNSEELNVSNYMGFINDRASWYRMQAEINPEVAQLDKYKTNVESFYGYSFQRDQVFISNLNKYAEGRKSLFMVTGGFHTDNMKDLLKKEGFSYILITPKLAQEKYNPYFKLLAGGLSPIETMLSEYTSLLALRSVFSDMGIKDEWNSMRAAKEALTLATLDERGGGNGVVLVNRKEEQVTYLNLTFNPVTGLQPIGMVGDRNIYLNVIRANEITEDTPVYELEDTEMIEGAIKSMIDKQAAAPKPAKVEAETPAAGLDGYIQKKQEKLARAIASVRPDFKVGVVVEVEPERVLPDLPEKASKNIRQDLEQLVQKRIISVLGYRPDIKFDISTSRGETGQKVSGYIEAGYRPVVFTLKDNVADRARFPEIQDKDDLLGQLLGERRESLMGQLRELISKEPGVTINADDVNLIPWVSLNMPEMIKDKGKSDNENIAAVDFDYLLVMGILEDGLNVENKKAGADLTRFRQQLAEIRAAVENSDTIKELPEKVEDLIYNGIFSLDLPRITAIDTNARFREWYDSFRKISVAA